ncbi:MAG: hypothetical protein OHK0021_04290 [Bryobacter sp.]
MTEEAGQRRQRKHDRQKQIILAAASRLFAQHGYNDVTIRRIAEEADCSQGLFYSYFSHKLDILHHLCEETFEMLEARLDAVIGATQAAGPALLAASLEFAHFCTEHPHHFKVFLMASTDFGDQRAVEFIGERGLATFHRLRHIYEAADLPVEKPHGSFIWWNGLKGVVDFVNLHRERPWFDAEALLRQTIATQWRGHGGRNSVWEKWVQRG